MRALSLSILVLVVACQEPARPEPAAPVASVAPVASAPVPAPSVTASASPSPSAAAVDPPPAAKGPVASKDDAVARAVPAANAALDRAYAKTKPPTAPHTGPWVRAEDASVEGDAKRGFRVKWSRHPPGGFDHEAEVMVSANGDVKVVKATAGFSSD